MRLDKFLKVSRIIKRRTLANEACDAGRVSVNGKEAKAGLSVKEGDIIEFEHVDTKEILKTQVIKLHKYKTFKELFNEFDKIRIGIKENEDVSIMDNFYSKEDQEKYEALGIEIKLI